MGASATIPFRKMNGLGNEIVVVDLRGKSTTFSSEAVQRISSTPGSHFDQMMVLHDPRTRGTDAFIRIYNADGTEAGACGNGMRCVALLESRANSRPNAAFETSAGVLGVTVRSQSDITVDMGEPRFRWDEIPLAEPFHDTRGIELQVGPIDAPVIHSPSVVNVGNPHAIFWVDDLDVVDLGRVGPMLENHPVFPERANISLARITSSSSLDLKTWERGAGLTKACGSAACAAAVAAARKGLTGRKVTVTLPGGKLVVEWTEGNKILMTGPAEFEFDGALDAASLAPL